MTPLIVIDTETTGLVPDEWARVIELGAVLVDQETGDVLSTFESLIRPDILDERAEPAMTVNNIDPASLRSAPDARTVVGLFDAWRGPHAWRFGILTTAWPVTFDRLMLERTGLGHIEWGECLTRGAAAIMGPAGALRAADPTHYRYVPDSPWLRPSLAEARVFFGVPVVGTPHRALTDARVAAGIAVAIRRRELA